MRRHTRDTDTLKPSGQMKNEEGIKKAIKILGRKPVNPVGECFDSTGVQAMDWAIKRVRATVCHGIGIATMPGQEGRVNAHAWLERDGVAYDTTWGIKMDAKKYREGLKLSFLVEYSLDEFLDRWRQTDHPGPWHEEIRKITERVDAQKN